MMKLPMQTGQMVQNGSTNKFFLIGLFSALYTSPNFACEVEYDLTLNNPNPAHNKFTLD